MKDSGSGTHCLNLSDSDNPAILFAVTVLQMSFQWDGNNFHIFMRMRLETFSGSNLIVVQYAKGTEVDTVRIKVLVKAESMITIQPVMLGMSSCICFMYYFLHNFLLF